MFHWICPECGRENPPSSRECPVCDRHERLEAAPAISLEMGRSEVASAGGVATLEAPPAPAPAVTEMRVADLQTVELPVPQWLALELAESAKRVATPAAAEPEPAVEQIAAAAEPVLETELEAAIALDPDDHPTVEIEVFVPQQPETAPEEPATEVTEPEAVIEESDAAREPEIVEILAESPVEETPQAVDTIAPEEEAIAQPELPEIASAVEPAESLEAAAPIASIPAEELIEAAQAAETSVAEEAPELLEAVPVFEAVETVETIELAGELEISTAEAEPALDEPVVQEDAEFLALFGDTQAEPELDPVAIAEAPEMEPEPVAAAEAPVLEVEPEPVAIAETQEVEVEPEIATIAETKEVEVEPEIVTIAETREVEVEPEIVTIAETQEVEVEPEPIGVAESPEPAPAAVAEDAQPEPEPVFEAAQEPPAEAEEEQNAGILALASVLNAEPAVTPVPADQLLSEETLLTTLPLPIPYEPAIPMQAMEAAIALPAVVGLAEPEILPEPQPEVMLPPEPERDPEPPLAGIRNLGSTTRFELTAADQPHFILAHEPSSSFLLPGPMLTQDLEGHRNSTIVTVLGQRQRRSGGIPGWAVTLMVTLIVLITAASVLFYRAPADPAQVATAVTSPSAASSNPLANYVQVTGVRFLINLNGKNEVHYLVVNQSNADMTDVALNITIRSVVNDQPICSFSIHLNRLAPYESKELSTTIEKLPQPFTTPDWRDIKTDVDIQMK